MGIVNKIIPHYTYADYIQWEGRWELIEGHPIAMSPLPVPKHQKAAANLRMELGVAIREKGCKKCVAYDPLDYKISEDTIIQPDILVVCKEINKPYLDFPPALVVEVLSPSTALRDRNTKYEIYQQQGIKYYLIADTEKEIIEVYELKEKKYQLAQRQNGIVDFVLDDDCSVSVDLNDIW